MNRHVPYGHCAAPSQMPPPMCPRRERLLSAIEEILKTEPRTELRRYARTRYLELTDPCNDNERAA